MKRTELAATGDRARRRSRCALWSIVVAALLSLCCLGAAAKDDFSSLKPNEGLLLLVIDNEIGASSLRLDGPGILSDDLAKNLGKGVNLRLMRFPAGEYHWSKVNRPNWWGGYSYYTLPEKPEYRFRIEAGVINYPGDFVMQASYGDYSLFSRTNRALLAMSRIDADFPGVRGRFPWRMDVAAQDPFPEFLAEHVPSDHVATLANSAAADAKKQLEQELPAEFSSLFKDLFVEEGVQAVRLNPAGDLLAYADVSAKASKVVVVDLASGGSHVVGTFLGSVLDMDWGGDRSLLIDYPNVAARVLSVGRETQLIEGQVGGVRILRIADGAVSDKSFSQVDIADAGLVDALPGDPHRAIVNHQDSGGRWNLYAIDKTATHFGLAAFDSRVRLYKGADLLQQVFVDVRGDLGAAVVVRGKGEDAARFLVVPQDKSWRTVRKLTEDEPIRPYLLTADGKSLVALSDFDRDQVDVVRLDLATGNIAETLMSVPGTDIIAPVLRRSDRALLGATVIQAGMPRVVYREESRNSLSERIKAMLPDSEVRLLQTSSDGKRAVVLGFAEDNPGTYYLFNDTTSKLEKLLDVRASFAVAKPARSTVFSVRSPDGLEIQSFLTVPATGTKPFPLVVMPHGGPIGVADNRIFSPDIQLLANRGFAVLRVNYRGSGGAGKAFERAGHGKWGREIEQDVEQSLDHALHHFPLDSSRVALLGASYGGYSALMELIRQPDRFRCAVAISAVTDLPLLFSSSDWILNKSLVEQMKDIVGDPGAAMSELRERSPAYQYQRLTRPVLLVHGTADQRVSFEHAWRLRSLLAEAGHAPAWLPLPGGDHSLARPNDRLGVQYVSSHFLQQCLDPAAAAGAVSANAPGPVVH